ncbi:hypothetical protein BBP40_001332 [Aspergillus hancockii]|nr:hypothetical protein BBP40_001332 [Aspergillus hancockii]
MESVTENERFRDRLRLRLNRFRELLHDTSIHLPQHTKADLSLAAELTSISRVETSTTNNSLLLNEASGVLSQSTNTWNDEPQIENGRSALTLGRLEQSLANERSTLESNMDSIVSSDPWSAAYREAVENLGEEIDIVILEGKNVAQLFRELEEIEKEIAISFATADLDFAKQVAEMLEQISYIDDCDTLGQKADRKDIHKDFLRYSKTLRNLVQKATWEIVEDIKAMLYDREIARWLGGEKMSRQAQFHASLQEIRADQACEFLLKDTNFINWYHTSDSQQLAILGDMGFGKTVAMAFLVDELNRRKKYLLPQPKVCFYYCRDDETGKAIYIVSALILSLLEQLPGLKRPFFEWYKQAQASGMFDPATSFRKLEELLQKLLGKIDRPVFILIDGLDECDRASRNSILKLLKTLLQKVSGLKPILSSRPEEEILEQLHGTAKIELGSDAQRDAIVVEKTVERRLSYLSMNVKALVIERLSFLAQGSAIWTKMIIELIEVRRITAFEPMRRFLEETSLPRQLSDLYVTLLSRCTSDDPENRMLASTALKLLAVTHRSFSILELAWAVTLGVTPYVTTIDALARLVDHQRVISLIQPFIARVDFTDVKKRQVRLIHQSVKEFIIKEWTPNPPYELGPPLAKTHQINASQRLEDLEAFILDICIRYLLLDGIGNVDLFSEEQVAIAELPQESNLFSDNEEPVEYDPYCTWESWEENMIRYDPTDRGFDKLAQEQWGNELLCVAAGAGCMPIIRRLVTSAQHKAELKSELLREFPFRQQPAAFGRPAHQSIGEAVLGNHVDVVEYLIMENDIEAHLRYRNSRGENVLHLASRLCNPEMFRLLVPRFKEGAYQADDQGYTALVRIIVNPSASRNRHVSPLALYWQHESTFSSDLG